MGYCSLENYMDCIVRGVTKSRARLSDFHFLSLFCMGDQPTWTLSRGHVLCFLAAFGQWEA